MGKLLVIEVNFDSPEELNDALFEQLRTKTHVQLSRAPVACTHPESEDLVRRYDGKIVGTIVIQDTEET